MDIIQVITQELKVEKWQVEAAARNPMAITITSSSSRSPADILLSPVFRFLPQGL